MKIRTLAGLSSATGQLILHYLAVFAFAFGTQLVAGTQGAHISSLVALLISAGAAGLVAVAHIALGLVPIPPAQAGLAPNALGISLKIKTQLYQFATSVVVMFFSILGASLISGAAHLTSFPDAIAVLLAAIAAAVAGVAQYVVGLIPAPKA